ncbi:MAG TPA: Ig-like domain-containing protein [Gemmatimonadales bacterium]
MHQLVRFGRTGAVIAAVALLVRCGGSDLLLPSESGPATITKVKGDEQTGSVGAPLPDSVIVRIVDQRGTPVARQRVVFTPGPDAQGALVRPEAATTNSDGVAQAEWVLGPAAGGQSLTASVDGKDELSVAFQAAAHPADASQVEEAGGNDQEGPVGSELADPLEVLVTDRFGNPVEGVPVDWAAEDGSVDPATSSTGPDGKASTVWTLASSVGSQTATASSDGLDGSPVSFNANAASGGPRRLILVSGNNQSAAPKQELSQPLVVRLEDANGNGVSQRAVTWVIGSGEGSVSATTSTTDDNGEARVRWTLGPNPGVNTLNAVVSGIGFVSFRAVASSPGGSGGGDGGGGGGGGDGGGGNAGPVRLDFRVQPSDAEKGKKIEPAVQVAVLDRNGQVVTQGEFEIKLELPGDNDGRLHGHERKKTRSGIATFDDLNVDKEGQYRLRASSDGLPSIDSDVFEIHERDGHGKD